MRTACGIALLVACAAPRLPPPARSEVRVGAAACATAPEIVASVTRVLVEHHADLSGLVVEVTPTAHDDGGADVQLRVLRPSGEVGLDRRYTLAANDCASAADLFALAVDRWLTSFPEWAVPPPPIVPGPDRWIDVAALASTAVIAPPFGVEGAVGGLADYGDARDRFGGLALVRSGPSQPAGGGRFRELALLGGATWRHRFDAWDLRADLRAGVLRVRGLGLAVDAASWVPWWEAGAFFGRRIGRVTIGAEVAGTALRDHAVTRDGLVSQNIPLVRAGISATFELFSE